MQNPGLFADQDQADLSADEKYCCLMNDIATPEWAKIVLRLIWQRDVVDAANVMEILSELAEQRAAEVLRASPCMRS